MSNRRGKNKTLHDAAVLASQLGTQQGPKLKVCPGCGSVPWDFAHPGTDRQNQPSHCQDCGDKLVDRSELPNDIWKDPAVKERLKEGRSADDIMVLRCPTCDRLGYYNQGSSFTCRFCDVQFYCCSEDGPAPEGRAYLRLDESDCITLADTVTEPTDGYHNETQ